MYFVGFFYNGLALKASQLQLWLKAKEIWTVSKASAISSFTQPRFYLY